MLNKTTLIALAKSLINDGVYPALVEYNRLTAPTAAIPAEGVRTIGADHGEIIGLTLNENKANLSILVKTPMKVRVPTNDLGLGVVDTFRFNNYAIAADGRVNTRTLPVACTAESFAEIKAMGGLSGEWEEGRVYDLDFAALNLPLAAYPAEYAAADLCRLHRRLKVAKMAEKIKAAFTAAPDGGYTAEQLAFLKGLGITPANGYAPKREKTGDAPKVFMWTVEITPAGEKNWELACHAEAQALVDGGAEIENPKAILEELWTVKAGIIAGVTKLTGLDADNRIEVDGNNYRVLKRQKA